jgi:hypothetical protein
MKSLEQVYRGLKTKDYLSIALDYIAYLSLIICAGCLIYVVLWMNALRKGWLV